MTLNNTAERLTDDWLLESSEIKHRVERSFAKATTTYVKNARLQRLSAQWLFEQLHALLPTNKPKTGLDLGCGPGINLSTLSNWCHHLLACDLSEAMLAQAKRVAATEKLPHVKTYCADAEMLPMANNSVDWVYSNLMIQWCNPMTRAISEIYRVLKPGGVAVVSTLNKGSLYELEQAWKGVDRFQHINQFITVSEMKQHIALSAIETPTILRKEVSLAYDSVMELSRELKGLGANSVTSGKARGLTGKGRWKQMTENYEQFRTPQQKLPATYQLACIVIQKSAHYE